MQTTLKYIHENLYTPEVKALFADSKKLSTPEKKEPRRL
jgi:hypothetical protein